MRVHARHVDALTQVPTSSRSMARAAWHIRDPELIPMASEPLSAQVTRNGPQGLAYQVVGDMAIVPVHGLMLKSYSLWLAYMGEDQVLTPEVAAAVQAAAADPQVRQIVLHIDSPGGMAAGTDELAEIIYRASKSKSVVAWIDDLGASAAYYAASQADRIVTGPSGVVGSIGTYMVVRDYSAMLGTAGITTHVIKSGEHKGDGEPGTPVTAEQKAEWQREIDALTANFVSAVARGRKRPVSEVSAWADGRVHVGQAAVEIGMADAVLPTFQDLLAELRASGATPAGRRQQITPKPTPTAEGLVAQAQGSRTAVPNGPAAQATTPVPEEDTTMNKKLRQHLEGKGLATTATASEAIAFWQKLAGDDLAQANALAVEPAPAAVVTPPVVPATPATPQAVDATAIAKAERQRAKAIRAMQAQLGLKAEWADKAVDSGLSLAEAQEEALQEHAKTLEPVGHISVGADRNKDTMAEAIGDAIMAQRGVRPLEMDPVTGLPDKDKPRALHPRHTEFRGQRAAGMARKFLELCGHSTVGMGDPEVCKAVFINGPRVPMAAAGGFQGTADFPLLLANVSNKQLLIKYVEYPVQWPKFCGRTTAPDLKQNSMVRRGEVPNLPVVLEGEDYSYVTLGESREVYTLIKRGHILPLTWETLLNDDVGAFMDLVVDQGIAARRSEDVVAFACLTGNPDMGDGEALFDTAAHANMAVDEIGPPTVAALDEMELRMGLQTGLSADAYLNLEPAVVAVPRALSATMKSLRSSTYIPGVNQGITDNPWKGRLEQVSHALLDAHNPASWYGLTDPGTFPAIVLAFLRGMETPRVEQESGFDSDTRKYKITHFVFGKPTEWRAVYKNLGASA